MNRKILPLALLALTDPALAEEPTPTVERKEVMFPTGGLFEGISDEILERTVYVIEGYGKCDVAFSEAKEAASAGSVIRSDFNNPDKWCIQWPHHYIGETTDGKMAFAELALKGREPESCFVTATYNAKFSDAFVSSSESSLTSLEVVQLPSIASGDTKMMLCSDVGPLLAQESAVEPPKSVEVAGGVPQGGVDHGNASEGLPVFARASYLPTWAGIADGSLQYREGLVEGMPGLPPARFQFQLGAEPLSFASWLGAGAEVGVSFAESGSGLTNVGGLVEVKAGKIVDLGLSGGAHWEPSEPEAEALKGIPYMALGVRHDFDVKGGFSCGVGMVAEQTFPQGFDFQPGMFALGGELGCAYEGHISLPNLNVARHEKETQAPVVPVAPVVPPVSVLESEPVAQAPVEGESTLAEGESTSETERTSVQAWAEYLEADQGGNALRALELLKEAKALGSQEASLDAEIERLERDFGRVTLKGSTYGGVRWVVGSNIDSKKDKKYLDFALAQLNATGEFDGLLPLGKFGLTSNSGSVTDLFTVRDRIPVKESW